VGYLLVYDTAGFSPCEKIEYGQETIYINSSKWISGNYGPDNPLTINLDRQDNKDIISIYHIDNYENEKKSRVIDIE